MRRRCDIKNRFARWHFPYSEAAGESGCWKQTAVLLQMIPPIRFFFFSFFFLSKSSSRFGILLSPPTLKKEKDQPKKEIRGLQLKKYVGKMGRIDDLYISFCLSNRIWRKKVIFCSTLFVKFTNMYERKLDFFSEFIRALDFLHLQNHYLWHI